MARYSDHKNVWFDMWTSDKKSLLSVMYCNMTDDIKAGYDVTGKSITNQKNMIETYEKSFYETLDKFVYMTDEQIDKYCYFDLLKSGAID